MRFLSITKSSLGASKTMIKRFSGVVILLILPVLLNACIWGRQKINVEGFHEKAELVVAGETRADELTEILGTPPNAILPLKNGKKLYVYTFGDGKTEGFNLILFRIQKTNLGIDSGYFFIDGNNTVEEKIISNNSKDVPWEWWAFGG